MNEEQTNIPFQFGEKSLDFIAYPSKIDVAEGSARSSKSTSMMFKLGLRINASNYNQWFIAGNTSGVARRNLIDNKNGFLDMFKGSVRNGTDPKKGNHLIFTDTRGQEKIIYVFGFRDKARWEAVLGSTLGGGVIDEINTADIDFVYQVYRSLSTRDDSWLGCTLNPDDPDKEIYNLLINKCRPLKRWVHDIPNEIIEELKKVKPGETLNNAIYWHFNFHDNLIMTEKKIAEFKALLPVGSQIYNSLVLGIRGVSEGVIFGKYLNDSFFARNIEVVYNAQKQIMNEIEHRLKTNNYARYAIGIDLGNNEIKRGTVMTFGGIRQAFKGIDFIECAEGTKTEVNELVLEICEKIIKWYTVIIDRSRFEGVFIDGYGSIEIILPTIRKKLASMGYPQIKVELAVKFGDDGGRKARMVLMLLLINQKKMLFNNTEGCQKLYKMLRKIVYGEDGLPLDENKLENDYYDSGCYTITPFTTKLNNEIISLI